MNSCTACGHVTSANVRFCPNCGAQLTANATSAISGGAVNPGSAPGMGAAVIPGGGAVLSGTPVQPRTSRMAITALVLSCIPVCVWVVGLVLGIVSLVRISGRPRELKGKGLAIAAICIPAVWLVLGILAAIAVPNFLRFQSRAKQAEAKVTLRQIFTEEKAFADDHQGQLAAQFADLGTTFEGKRRYAYFLGQDVTQATEGGPYQIPSELADQLNQPDVVAFAVGNVDHDDTLDVWAVKTDGSLAHVQDDLKL